MYSQRVLLALGAQGMSRDDAYRVVQESAQKAWHEETPLRDLLAVSHPDLDLDELFDPSAFTRHADEIFTRLEEIA